MHIGANHSPVVQYALLSHCCRHKVKLRVDIFSQHYEKFYYNFTVLPKTVIHITCKIPVPNFNTVSHLYFVETFRVKR